MHDLLRHLSRTQLSPLVRYGTIVVAVGLGTLLRFIMPLDTAPFLLYLPIVFLGALALGWGAGLFGVILSDLFAGYFFLHDNRISHFTPGETIALIEYLIVGAVLLAICSALRKAILDNDRVVAELRSSRAALEQATADALVARTAAEDANKAKSAFLANMSHELRTPLSAVIGYSEMLEEEVEDLGEASMMADLGKIKSNAKHLLSLINDVLDLSKIEANKMELSVEPVDVAKFVQEVGATVESLVRRKENTLAIDAGPGLGMIDTDAVKLRQCLFNLLSNASKFTENGRITLTARRTEAADGDWLSFAVSDTGIGMTAEQVSRLFQRFMQADESTTRQFGGTGLGLALSRAFAELLGGTIGVESQPGVGTCFTLRIPVHRSADQTQEAVEAAADLPRDVVLVIDDEPSQRELMTRFLQRRGYSVRTASNGRVGLDLARALKPRVILLDVMMPEMDGWSVLSALKEHAETAAIPVVMISFVADPVMAASLGAAASIPKPVNWDRLETAMAKFARENGLALVVDDDAEMRARLRSVMERSGWRVAEAGNGAEALAQVSPPPDLVLLDLTMPVMDGFTFLHRLREMPGCADVPVMVLSARDITASERSELASADRILTKGETSMSEIVAEASHLRPS